MNRAKLALAISWLGTYKTQIVGTCKSAYTKGYTLNRILTNIEKNDRTFVRNIQDNTE